MHRRVQSAIFRGGSSAQRSPRRPDHRLRQAGWHRQLHRLVELSVTLNSTLDLDTLLQLITSTATELLECEAASILLYDEKNPRLYFAAATGSDPAQLAEIPEAELRACQLGFRARYIHQTARFLAAHPGWLEETEHLLPSRGFVQTTRIVRESVSNIIKHSGATRCSVRCRVSDGYFAMTIQDNGNGIPMELDGKLDRGLGMSNMKRRAKQMRGQCLVQSGPGYGTVIALTVPL